MDKILQDLLITLKRMATDPRDMLPELWFDCYIAVDTERKGILVKSGELEIGYTGNLYQLMLWSDKEITWTTNVSINRPDIYICSSSLSLSRLKKLSEGTFQEALRNAGKEGAQINHSELILPFLEHHYYEFLEKFEKDELRRKEYLNLIHKLCKEVINEKGYSEINKNEVEKWIKLRKGAPAKNVLSLKARMLLWRITGLEQMKNLPIDKEPKAKTMALLMGMHYKGIEYSLGIDPEFPDSLDSVYNYIDEKTTKELIRFLKLNQLKGLIGHAIKLYENTYKEAFPS